ncbi:MAG TPA: putative Ig domain-containing protein, partial [Chthoniobacterales bacterium]
AQPTSYSASGLPAGFNFNPATGLITASPTSANPGNYIVTLTATNSDGTSTPVQLHLVVTLPAPVITSAASVHVAANQQLTYQVTATNQPTSYRAENVPPGFSFDETTGQLTGASSGAGSFQITLHALNLAGEGTLVLTLTIDAPPPPPVITSPTTATATRNQPFSYQITASNNPKYFSASALPSGLTLNVNTGLISGTPLVTGTFSITIVAGNDSGVGNANLQLTINPQPVPVITSATDVSAMQGRAFTYQITATNNPTSFGGTGLPAGLSLNAASGLISGTPTISGNFDVTISATNSGGSGTAILHLHVLPPPAGIGNISTRLSVGTNENVLIAGFIITGSTPKKLIIRSLGPSLKNGDTPVPGTLQDPMLELDDAGQTVLASNDSWRSAQEQEIIATGVQPGDNREAAMIVTLNPGAYTAIVSGKNGTTGIATVEVYDLDNSNAVPAPGAKLANISTRGFVQTNDNVLIGGFIITGATTKVIARAIGPELTAQKVAGALQDTTLDLVDANGEVIIANDDWRSAQEQEITASQVAPTDDREAAVVASLPPGGYTAIVRGKKSTTGVATVEIYVLP